jgi:hypothetical protein
MSRTMRTRSQARNAEAGPSTLPPIDALMERLSRYQLDVNPDEPTTFRSFAAHRDEFHSSTPAPPRSNRNPSPEGSDVDDDGPAVERDATLNVPRDQSANSTPPLRTPRGRRPSRNPGPPGGPPDDDGDDGDDPVQAPLPVDPHDQVLAQLAAAIATLAQATAVARQPSDHQRRTKIREPDQFDGSDPRKLRTFLVQCELNFQDRPRSFDTDRAKVLYAQSFLKGTVLDWFEPDLLNGQGFRPRWVDNYEAFVFELESNFGPYDPEGEAEDRLDELTMGENQRITKYLVEFNRYASQVRGYGMGALRRRFYKGLPDRLKDEISRVGKPRTLHDMRSLAQEMDARYWDRKAEQGRRPKPPAPTHSSSSTPSTFSKPAGKSKPASTPSFSSAPPSSDNVRPKGKNVSRPDLTSKLGKDGKLTKEERQRRFENKLCLFCGHPGHVAKECPKSSSRAAKARAAKAAEPVESEESVDESDEPKN